MAQPTQNSNGKNAVSLKNNTANRNKLFSVGKDNQAVSAVIGVILMVAITVILAAIIGVFVMNMSSNLPKMPGYAAFSVQRDAVAGTVAGTPGADTLTITNVAQNGEPITVVKLKIVSGGNTYYLNPESPATDFSALTEIAGTQTVAITDDLDAYIEGPFDLTIIGMTADGGENILQTFSLPADTEAA